MTENKLEAITLPISEHFTTLALGEEVTTEALGEENPTVTDGENPSPADFTRSQSGPFGAY
jgi:hypothetical protein